MGMETNGILELHTHTQLKMVITHWQEHSQSKSKQRHTLEITHNSRVYTKTLNNISINTIRTMFWYQSVCLAWCANNEMQKVLNVDRKLLTRTICCCIYDAAAGVRLLFDRCNHTDNRSRTKTTPTATMLHNQCCQTICFYARLVCDSTSRQSTSTTAKPSALAFALCHKASGTNGSLVDGFS